MWPSSMHFNKCNSNELLHVMKMLHGTFMYFCVMSNLLVCLAWFNLKCHVVIHVCMYIWVQT
jgi:hypothetical protein